MAYTPNGLFFDAVMSEADRAKIKALSAAYAAAQTNARRAAIHAKAEAIRLGYGYSGGADGSEYIPKSRRSSDIDIPEITALRSARQTDLSLLREKEQELRSNFYLQANRTEGSLAADERGFNEYAAALGLNSGAAEAVRDSFDKKGRKDSQETQAQLEIQLGELDAQRVCVMQKYRKLLTAARGK